MTEQYRIEDKATVTVNGVPAVSFDFYEFRGSAFYYAGQFFRPGSRRATDEQCIEYALATRGSSDYDEYFPDPARAV